VTGRLVALDLPAGPGFVDALRRIWDDGDAALPLDPRLPPPARAAVLDAMAPHAVVDPTGTTRLAGGRAVEEGDALVVVTSGTTGAPKGVVLTHEAVTASAKASSVRLGVDPSDHWLACLPLSHVGGLSVVTRALVTGTALTVQAQFDPADAPGATLVSLVPTMVVRADRTDLVRFRRILLGGAAPPDDLAPNVVVTYGMTETGSGIVYDGLPLDGVEVTTLDDELIVRGPMLLRCYRDGTVPLVDGWLRTGDAGRVVDGRVDVVGRIGDVVVTGGEKVWPDAVEAILRTHPSVAEVAVAGVPDAEWGAVVTAFVVAAGEPPTLDALREHVRAQLPAYAAPRRLVLVESLPRTVSGKVRRDVLRREATAE
jgi:O-succinylbenzoic acid--CoA ligase